MYSLELNRSGSRYLLTAFALICVSVQLRAEDSQKAIGATDELLQLEKVWNEAHLKGDAAALDRLWADDLEVVVPKMAAMKKQDVLAFARSGRMQFQDYTTSNVQVRMFGDVALVSGKMKRSRMLRGESVTDNWQFTKIYRRKNDHWKVVHFQASEAPPP